jgi:hypothetical protein
MDKLFGEVDAVQAGEIEASKGDEKYSAERVQSGGNEADKSAVITHVEDKD